MRQNARLAASNYDLGNKKGIWFKVKNFCLLNRFHSTCHHYGAEGNLVNVLSQDKTKHVIGVPRYVALDEGALKSIAYQKWWG